MTRMEIKATTMYMLSKLQLGRVACKAIEDNGKKSFFVYPFNFNKNHMIYFFFMLENEFKIRFTQEDIENERLYTLLGMVDIIECRLAGNET